jgi:hypothetical protein
MNFWNAMNMRLLGPRRWLGCFEEEKNNFFLSRIETLVNYMTL